MKEKKKECQALCATRSAATQSAAQRAHATRTRQTRTHTRVVHSRAVFVSSHPRTALLLCLPHGGSSLCLTALGGSSSVWWPLAFPCVVDEHGSVSLPFFFWESVWCTWVFLDGHLGDAGKGVRYNSTDKHDAHSGHYFYESFVSGSHFFALLRC